MTAEDWKQKGRFIKIFNRTVFMIDEGTSDKTMVILHGYPTSSFDYYKVLPELTQKHRVIIHDHVGFGFSDKPLDYSYSLVEQADVALELWKQLGLQNVTLLAHDYGTSVATEIIARQNKNQLQITIDELILCNGSAHIELAKLRPIQKLLRRKITGKLVGKLANQWIFDRNIRKIYQDKSKVTQDELDQMWFQINHNNGRKVIHLLSNYINERYYYWHRWIGALKETSIPTKIVWATNDPIAVTAIAKKFHEEIPNNELLWLENTGHFPMLENPDDWIQLVLS